jgi:hypothetical protein
MGWALLLPVNVIGFFYFAAVIIYDLKNATQK